MRRFLLPLLLAPALAYAAPLDLFNSRSTVSRNDLAPQIFTCNGTDQTAKISSLLSAGGSFYFKGGTCSISSADSLVNSIGINLTSKTFTLDMAPDTYFHPRNKMDNLFKCTGCTIHFKRFNVDGDGLAQTAFYGSGGSFQADNVHIIEMGYPVDTATNIITGLELRDYTAGSLLKIGKVVMADFNSVGNGSCGDAVGSVRGIYFQDNAAIYDVGYFEMSGGTGTEDNDYFQAQLSNTGGTIHNLVARYNENTRRIFKAQSGNHVIEHVDIRKGSDFDAVSGSTDVGLYNLNAIDFATNAAGSIDIVSGYIDCMGFTVCVGNSGGTAQVRTGPGLTMKGAIQAQTRDATACNGALAGTDSIGFYATANDVGSGVDGSRIINFGKGAVTQGKQNFIRDAVFVDPVNFAAEVGSSTTKDGAVFTNNEVITRTSGYLNSTRIVRVFDVTNAKISGNRLIEDGNTGHATRFIDFTDADATGIAMNNVAPSGTTAVNFGSAVGVFDAGQNGLPAGPNSVNTSATTASASTTLANITSLTGNVAAGKTYAFRAHLFFTADATGGHKYAMGGTATATGITYYVRSTCDATGTTIISSKQTALAGAAGENSSSCTAGETIIEGVIVVNAAGTLTAQFAQNSANNSSSVLARSNLMITRLN